MNKISTKRIVLLMILAAVLFVAAQNIGVIFEIIGMFFSVLTPLILGGCIAFIINMPMRFFEKLFRRKLGFNKHKWTKKILRPVSLIVSVLIILTAVALIGFIIVPDVANTILSISNNVPGYVNNIVKWSQETFEKYPQIEQRLSGVEIDWKQISSTALSVLQGSAEVLLNSTFSIATNVVGGVVNFFMAFVFSIYILMQKEKLSFHAKRAVRSFLPVKWARRITRVASLTGRTFSRFLAGQCLEAIILGTLIFIGMSIFKFPFALMISVLIAIMSFIPMFGIYAASVFGAVLIAFQENIITGLLFFVMFVVIQQIEGNFIYPHVVGNSVGLSPLVVLSAVMIGGGLFGFVGMIIGVPVSAVLVALYKAYMEKRTKFGGSPGRLRKANIKKGKIKETRTIE